MWKLILFLMSSSTAFAAPATPWGFVDEAHLVCVQNDFTYVTISSLLFLGFAPPSLPLQTDVSQNVIAAPIDLTVAGGMVTNILGNDNGGVGTSNGAYRYDVDGHLESKGTAGSYISCGTSPGPFSGNDNDGQVTVGTGGAITVCSITFNVTWGAAPMCVASSDTQAIGFKIVTTTTTMAMTPPTTITAGSKITYHCSKTY